MEAILLPIFFAVIVAPFFIWSDIKRKKQNIQRKEQQEQERKNQFLQFVCQHIDTLARKRRQKRQKDDYGLIHEEEWIREKKYFLLDTVTRAFTDHPLFDHPLLLKVSLRQAVSVGWVVSGFGRTFGDYDRSTKTLAVPSDLIDWLELIDVKIDEYLHSKDGASFLQDEPLDPLDYESFCANLLSAHGWETRLTKQSGDQGVDIIAEKNGRKAVIQCKRYSNTAKVGNGAVQEIIAGREFYKANVAAVISNVEFTPSAMELAQSCAVHLLHHSQISRLNEEAG